MKPQFKPKLSPTNADISAVKQLPAYFKTSGTSSLQLFKYC